MDDEVDADAFVALAALFELDEVTEAVELEELPQALSRPAVATARAVASANPRIRPRCDG